MFNSDVLDIVIGLVFVYWLFSLLCTALTEGVARFLALRSNMLWIGIRNMLEAKSKTTSSGLLQERIDLSARTLYATSTFESLSKSGWLDWIRFWQKRQDTYNKPMPSYVAPGTFALALFDTLLTASQFLFSLGFVSRLDKGIVPKALVDSFNTKLGDSRITTDSATVTVKKAGSQWKLDDDTGEYLIKKEDSGLELYKNEKKAAAIPDREVGDLIRQLDRKELSDDLKTEFKDHDKTRRGLNEATVIVEEAGSQWMIKDTRTSVYSITKGDKKLSLCDTSVPDAELASVKVDQHVAELNNGLLSGELKAKFRDQGKKIGGQVTVADGPGGPAGSNWEIKETSTVEYRIKHEDKTLNVYAVGKESDESEAEMAEQLRAIRVKASGLKVFATDKKKQTWLDDLQRELQRPSSDSTAFQPKAQQTFRSLEEGIDKIRSEYLRSQLKPILRTAEEETQNWEDALAKARIGFETWFDDRMERVTGWYTRNTRCIVFLMALIVTLLFNIDTLAIADALSADTTLRETVAGMASDAAKQNAQSNQGAQTDAGTTGVSSHTPISPTVSTTAPVSPTVNTSDLVPPAVSVSVPASQTPSISQAPNFSETLNTLDQLGLPIGWVVAVEGDGSEGPALNPFVGFFVTEMAVATEADAADIDKAIRYRQQMPKDGESWGKKIAGLLFTVVMLSLGAPFWFDVLGKLSNLRAAGKVPKVPDTTNTNTG